MVPYGFPCDTSIAQIFTWFTWGHKGINTSIFSLMCLLDSVIISDIIAPKQLLPSCINLSRWISKLTAKCASEIRLPMNHFLQGTLPEASLPWLLWVWHSKILDLSTPCWGAFPAPQGSAVCAGHNNLCSNQSNVSDSFTTVLWLLCVIFNMMVRQGKPLHPSKWHSDVYLLKIRF